MKKQFILLSTLTIMACVIFTISSCSKKNNDAYSVYYGNYVGSLTDSASTLVSDTVVISAGSASNTINILDKNTNTTIVCGIISAAAVTGYSQANLTITNQSILLGATSNLYSGSGSVTNGTLNGNAYNGINLSLKENSNANNIFNFSGNKF